MWIGYYSKAYDTFAPWFFQEDYGPSLGKGLRELGHPFLTGALALLYPITADAAGTLEMSFVVWTDDQES